MIDYTTDTGIYILKDADGRVGAKANVDAGTHPVPDWVDPEQSTDLISVSELADHDIDPHYK